MSFRVTYHPLVIRDDISKLSPEWKVKIKSAIESRLQIQPQAFGKPLRRSLAGYRKLRVGDYRVIFLLEKDLITIFAIKHRSLVYERINKRIK
ncbi:MAG: type II toxin-antitoxin system RelE/ParE family toxin [Candidatus Buchananbacteria bacterium]|nr:type II toxin-antitoxin system RelE/ParE family toxin [Candidatus Buchananbacteria bacterium]